MGKLELKIGFNGEQKSLFNQISEFEYLVQEGENTLISSSYFNSDGSLPYGHLNDIPRLKILKIKNLDIISFQIYVDYDATPSYLYLKDKKVYYYSGKGSSVLLNKNLNDYWSQTRTSENIVTYEFRLKDAIINAIANLGASEASDDSYVRISFPNVPYSTEDLSFNYGYIKFIFPEETSYLTYANDTFDNVEFIRQINVANSPSFSLNEGDGDVRVIDKDLYIQERLKTNQIKNYFLTKILYNGKQVGKYIGVDGKYPYSEKRLTYTLNDYISLLSNIECEDFYYYGVIPLSGIIDGYELYNKIKEQTIKLAQFSFEILSESKINYLKDFLFIDPYIKCKNLKELWESFLNATLTNLFINELGQLSLDVFLFANQEKPIILSKEQIGQDTDFNLVANNAISKVVVASKIYSEFYSNVENNTFQIGTFAQTGKRTYSDIVNNYLDWLEQGNTGVYNIKSQSMFLNFYEKADKKREADFEVNEAYETFSITETNILAESFIDLKENLYQKLYIKYKFNYDTSDNLESLGLNYIENGKYYEYNIVWLSKTDYDSLTIQDMEYNTLYFNSQEYLTKTGRLFKCLIPCEYGLLASNNLNYYCMFFTSMQVETYTKEINDINVSYGENEVYKSEYKINNSNLLLIDKDLYIPNYIYETNDETLSASEYQVGDIILIKKDDSIYDYDENIYNLSTLYIVNNDGSGNYIEFLSINTIPRYKGVPLSVFIAQTLQKLYNNGRKSIKFTTSSYNFFNSEGILQYNAQNGEILKVGDLIQLPSVSEQNFKIVKISASYDGYLSLNVVAIEMSKEEETADFIMPVQDGDKLTIYQVYSAEQNNEILEVE